MSEEADLFQEARKEKHMLLRQICRIGLVILVAVLFCFINSPITQALDYPKKPIHLIIPSGVGGASDMVFRAVSTVAPKHLAQPLVIEMKPGGGGAIGSEFVARSAPDGYTILCGSPNWTTILPAVEGLSKGPNDLAAVCRLTSSYGYILVRSDAPFKTYKELIEAAKAKPGELVFGNTGPWGLTDLLWKAIMHKTGIKVRNVPHQGGGALLLALLGGNVQVGAMTPNQSMPHIKAGKLRAVLVLDDKRDPDLPGVPSAKEEGLDFTFPYWQSVMAPKTTPHPIIEKLAGDFKKMTEDPALIKAIKDLGSELAYMGPDEAAKFLRDEFELYKELGKIYKQ
jgi:tripartite-type tricarboxylate transporter receptor subunit TctC